MESFINWITSINNAVNGVVWGVTALTLLIGTGIVMTILTKGFQFTRFGLWMRETIGKLFTRDKNRKITKSKDKNSISQFQALCTALSATIGTGNIAGIAYAITMGGPGAVFWMWIAAIVGMMTNFLSPSSGIINQIIKVFGGKPINFMSNPAWFRRLYVISGSWQSFGFNAIIFVAAIMGIDPSLYEAMKVDGASRWQQIIHLILPMIADTVILLLIMTLGNLLNVGFEKVYLMYSPAVYETGDVIATYVYRQGIENKNFSYAAAVGLFYSAVGFVFVMASNSLSRRVTGSSLW